MSAFILHFSSKIKTFTKYSTSLNLISVIFYSMNMENRTLIDVILYNYCTWTRSIWGFMKQSTTILNEAKPSSILLYSAPWNLILIKFKCSNCFITYKALFYSNFEILWKLKFLKVWNFIKILNFNFFFNQKKFLIFWIFFLSFEL